MDIQVFNTYIDPTAADKVKEVLDSTFVSEGELVKKFEKALTEKLRIVNPVAVNSGTSALHLALVLAGIGEGDEVILPAQTFIATGMVVVQQKAKPVFADIQYHTGNIDPLAIEKKITPRTKAIIAVHWAGYPCDLDEIRALALKHHLILIEDAAHALGSTYKNQAIGSLSDYTCFSFQAIKHVTTGDGGAIACLDPEMARQAGRRRWFGIDRVNSTPSILGEREYNVRHVGYKYHLSDYAAALGLANLDGFKERLAKRIKIAKFYRDELATVPGISLFNYKSDRTSAYWLFGIHVDRREDFIKAMKARGVATSVVHLGIDRNSIFGGQDHSLTNQLKFNQTQINIPLHDGLTETHAKYIVNAIKKGW